MTAEEWAEKLHKWFQQQGGYAHRSPGREGYYVCLDDTWNFQELAEFIMAEILKEKEKENGQA